MFKSGLTANAVSAFDRLPYALLASQLAYLTPPLPELAKKEALEYYTLKKEGQIGMKFVEGTSDAAIFCSSFVGKHCAS
jgi:hypothetical protein